MHNRVKDSTNKVSPIAWGERLRDLRRTLGSRIVDLRRSRGWSQAELAERLNVTRDRLSKWEIGRSAPAAEDLVALGEVLGASVDELLTGKPALEPAARQRLAGHVAAIVELLAART